MIEPSNMFEWSLQLAQELAGWPTESIGKWLPGHPVPAMDTAIPSVWLYTDDLEMSDGYIASALRHIEKKEKGSLTEYICYTPPGPLKEQHRFFKLFLKQMPTASVKASNRMKVWIEKNDALVKKGLVVKHGIEYAPNPVGRSVAVTAATKDPDLYIKAQEWEKVTNSDHAALLVLHTLL